MKLLLVGATGTIGQAYLDRALALDEITEVVALSRRNLPARYADIAKLKNVIVPDFEHYSEEVLGEIRGASACLWSVGGRMFQFDGFEAARRANVVLAEAGARQMAEQVESRRAEAATDGGEGEANTGTKPSKFRFVYTSGAFTEHDQGKKLHFLEQSRKLKGEAELALLAVERAHPTSFELVIGRPAGVLDTDSGAANLLYGPVGIGKGVLAAAMVDFAVRGSQPSQTVENRELKAAGQATLAEGKKKGKA